ncbi:MAG TPA: glycosyl hydrolase [Candidatus Hydrogenedentes bacterium]|nr:glycosyl hydrolase [Candidatus Hydrogenedentota bacterium]
MRVKSDLAILVLALCASVGCLNAVSDPLPEFTAAWPEADSTAKPWMRWWWPGNAPTTEDARGEMEMMAAAGLGGVELTPIYGSRDGLRPFRPFLSAPYLETLKAATEAAASRGMGFDMCTGTGWPFGGPWVKPEDTAKKIIWAGGRCGFLPTGQQVKRAAPGGEGPVLDPFDPEALARYLQYFTDRLAEIPRGRIRCQTHDSFEYYEASWTPALPARFEQRFGYPLEEAARLIFDPGPQEKEQQERARYDYRLFLAEQHLAYVRAWRDWCAEMGFLAREQAHGAPANLLDLYGASDIPEMETFGARDFPIPGYRDRQADPARREDTPEPLIWRFAASAAHAGNKRLVSCETCTWIRNHWHASPGDIKPFLDELFCAGINHVVFHGWCFSPREAPWPGWYFYAAEQFNPRNPLWPAFVDMFGWIARAQSLLQQSRPDNDLLLFWPFDDALTDFKPDRPVAQFTVHDPSWALDTPFGEAARLLTLRGFGVDYLSDLALETASVEGGSIRLPGGRWRALVVPRTIRMRPETLGRILDLTEQGAAVLMEQLPETVPGLGHLTERKQQLEQQRRRVSDQKGAAGMEGEKVRRVRLGSGSLLLGPMKALLRAWDGRPETLGDTGLTWIRRKASWGTLYYLACLRDRPVAGWVSFNRGGGAAVLMDPVSGKIGRGALRKGSGDDAAEVYLQLSPGQSIFVAFPDQVIQGEPDPWPYHEIISALPAGSEPWTLHFETGVLDALPADQTLSELCFWTDLDDPACRRFSGAATYRTQIQVPNLEPGQMLALSLGDVRHAARIRIDREDRAAAWCLPFAVMLDPPPAPGEHTLEITVFSTGANAIRDLDRKGASWKIMDNANIVDIHYKPLDASTWPVVPSGLAGPVELRLLKAFKPE